MQNSNVLPPEAAHQPATESNAALSIDLANLGEILKANEALKTRSILAISNKLAVLPQDMTQLQVIDGDAIDAELNDLQARGAQAVTMNNGRRTPFTKRMDEVRALFTSYEKDIQEKVDLVKSWRNRWSAEKHRRDQAQKAEMQKEQDKKNAETEYVKSCSDNINAQYMNVVRDLIEKLNNAFNTQTLESFPDYELRLTNYQPVFQAFEYMYPVLPTLLDGDQAIKLRATTESQVFPILQSDFLQKITDERDRLIGLIPSRKAELKTISTDSKAAEEARIRQENETRERQQKLDQEEADRKKANEATANNTVLTQMLDATIAQPAIEITKGTTIKKKYVPTSHQAFIAIIQNWVINNMKLLTIEELNKKLGFMITAANQALNDKKAPAEIKAEGLRIEEDFNTRTTKPKKES